MIARFHHFKTHSRDTHGMSISLRYVNLSPSLSLSQAYHPAHTLLHELHLHNTQHTVKVNTTFLLGEFCLALSALTVSMPKPEKKSELIGLVACLLAYLLPTSRWVVPYWRRPIRLETPASRRPFPCLVRLNDLWRSEMPITARHADFSMFYWRRLSG